MYVTSYVRAASSVEKLFLSAPAPALCCCSAVILPWASKCQWQNESWALIYTLRQDSWWALSFPCFFLSKYHRYHYHFLSKRSWGFKNIWWFFELWLSSVNAASGKVWVKQKFPAPCLKRSWEIMRHCVEQTLQSEQCIIYISFVCKISLFRWGRNSYATFSAF